MISGSPSFFANLETLVLQCKKEKGWIPVYTLDWMLLSFM